MSGRYDHYSDVGDAFTPAIGLGWTPVGGLKLRGTYSQSFHAPFLDQVSASAYPTSYYTDLEPNQSGQNVDVLFAHSYFNPNLKPQTSTNFTVGVDYQPAWLEGLVLTGTYFNIAYRNLISNPVLPNNTYYFNPINAPYLNASPTAAQIQAGTSSSTFEDYTGLGVKSIGAIFNYGLINIARTTVDGIDMSATYSTPFEGGMLNLHESTTYQLDQSYQTSPTGPSVNVLNLLGEPLRFRSRTSVGWTVDQISSLVTFDYRNGYFDTNFTPAHPISAWTTIDLRVGYRISDSSASWLLNGLTLSVGAQNILDTDPPHVSYLTTATNSPGFDPYNANPFGRVISLNLDKKW